MHGVKPGKATHLLNQAHCRVEVNVVVGQQLRTGGSQILDVLPAGAGIRAETHTLAVIMDVLPDGP